MPVRPPMASGSFPLRRAPNAPDGGWPRGWGPRLRLSEQLTANALVDAMDPRWQVSPAARRLVRRAGGNGVALRTALGRIQLRSLERPTPTAVRAARALRLALHLTGGRGSDDGPEAA